MKKIKTSISRNLILSFVLLITIIFAVLAWFSSVKEATARGISVISVSSKGLQVAFEDIDTAYKTTLVDNSQKQYPLVSSDGNVFIIPLLNRSTGVAITPYTSKRDVIPNQDYYETDLFFRSDEPLEISLLAGSHIVPNDIANNTLNNKSSFGSFTKDYIAGAARVAFYNVDKNGNETLNNIWIPNENYELIESSQFSKIEKVGSGASEIYDDPNETFGLYNTDLYEQSSYYLWEGHANSNNNVLTKLPTNKVIFKSKQENNLYYGAMDIESDTDVDHFINITNSTNFSYADSTIVSNKNNSEKSLQNYEFNGTKYWIGSYVEGGYNISYNNTDIKWAKLVVDSNPKSFFDSIDRFQILFTYNPTTNLVVIKEFVFYNSGTGEVGGGTGDFGSGPQNYVIEDGKTVVITGAENEVSHALSFVNNNPRAYELGTISNSMKLYNSNCMFIVENKGNNSYYLKHLPTNKYMMIDVDGKLLLSDSPVTFVLSSGNDVPLLMCNGYYLDFKSGEFIASTSNNASINIYEGTSFNFNKNGNVEANYYYLEAGKSAQTELSSDLYFTKISDCPTLAKLEVLDDSGYYKAHIKVRIWAEGTDREAKTPLAGGIFNNILKFTGSKIEGN